jgi:hypothetical protein
MRHQSATSSLALSQLDNEMRQRSGEKGIEPACLEFSAAHTALASCGLLFSFFSFFSLRYLVHACRVVALDPIDQQRGKNMLASMTSLCTTSPRILHSVGPCPIQCPDLTAAKEAEGMLQTCNIREGAGQALGSMKAVFPTQNSVGATEPTEPTEEAEIS